VCGTDVEFFTGEMAYLHQGHAAYPLRPGHEWCGRVTAVGDGVDPGWIGRRTSYLESVEEARAAIAGYVVVNDVSERGFQLERGGQWAKGKSAETFNPAGPWLATADEIDDVLALDMWLDVNGVRRQTGSTKTMVFDPYFIVHYLSQFLVLEPGDLINTGTPPGVGMGLTPPTYLRPGDVMELGIRHLGVQRQRVVAPR
jgi:2,4-didehydro-3-deoxy-L-rhamnonate hydrolase